MDKLKLLIVDDIEDNRLVLRGICRRFDYLDIKDATNGFEAVEITRQWKPHIILMDLSMPMMNGYEASKIIKEEFPQTVIMIVSGTSAKEDLSAIGVDIYINKPIDRNLIRFKIQSISESLRFKLGATKPLMKKGVINPFNSDIRSFKTTFEIGDEESMMDFGIWLYDQYQGKVVPSSIKYDNFIEVYYELMNHGKKSEYATKIYVEESYEEFYITIQCCEKIRMEKDFLDIIQKIEFDFLTDEHTIYSRLLKASQPLAHSIATQKPLETPAVQKEQNAPIVEVKVETEMKNEATPSKEKRAISGQEREMLHQSFTNKTTAQDYVNDIGGDIVDEILELASIDNDWSDLLAQTYDNPTAENISIFVDEALNTYTRAINNLFEFNALAYALTSLGAFLQNSAQQIVQDEKKTQMLLTLLEHLGEDLKSWREHLFVLQDTLDIHYLDSSFFSSCVQIEGIVMNQDVGSDDDDNDLELF